MAKKLDTIVMKCTYLRTIDEYLSAHDKPKNKTLLSCTATIKTLEFIFINMTELNLFNFLSTLFTIESSQNLIRRSIML